MPIVKPSHRHLNDTARVEVLRNKADRLESQGRPRQAEVIEYRAAAEAAH